MATPALEGAVLSVWRRHASRNCDNPKAAELCYGVFHRERMPAGPVSVDKNGIVNSHEYHRTQGNITEIAKSGGTVDANMGERAFLVQSLPQIEQLCGLYPELAPGISAPCAWGYAIYNQAPDSLNRWTNSV